MSMDRDMDYYREDRLMTKLEELKAAMDAALATYDAAARAAGAADAAYFAAYAAYNAELNKDQY
jgi:hypothetical protein